MAEFSRLTLGVEVARCGAI